MFVKPASGRWAGATQTAELTAPDGAPADNLGVSAAVSGDLVVAGAPLADVGANPDEGAAYAFDLTPSVSPGPGLGPDAHIRVLSRHVRMGPRGRVRLRVRCRTSHVSRCRGWVKLAARRYRLRRHGRAWHRIGRRRYSVARGRHHVHLRLYLGARRAVRRTGALPTLSAITVRRPHRPARRTHRAVRVRAP